MRESVTKGKLVEVHTIRQGREIVQYSVALYRIEDTIYENGVKIRSTIFPALQNTRFDVGAGVKPGVAKLSAQLFAEALCAKEGAELYVKPKKK